MSRSTRKNLRTTAAANSTATPEEMVHAARSIKNYTFEYQRDRISHRAGSCYFRLETNSGDGQPIEMSLQEAQSLYNFLGNALSR